MSLNSVDWQSIKFGVEIEFIGGEPEKVELLPGWIMSLDELQTDANGEESGSELKPPPMLWEDREQIRVMLDRLRAGGAEANWSCGLHVHVGLEPWGEDIVPRLLDAALDYQETIRALLQTADDRLIYCPSVPAEMRDRFQASPCGESLEYNGRPQSHRCGINLAAWFDIGTVEIRYANGSLDYGEVMNTVELCLRFVAAIGAGRKLPSDPHAVAIELGAPLDGYPPPQPAPRWHRERVWLEEALIPTLTPLASSLVPDGEIHHIFPRPDGFLVGIEDSSGKLHSHLCRLNSEGWTVVRELTA